MYDNWFASLGITEQDWLQCETILKNELPEALSDNEHSVLTHQLSAIDTSEERKAANRSVTGRKSNYLQEQFLNYINTSLMPTGYNSKKSLTKNGLLLKSLPLIQMDNPLDLNVV